MNEVIKNIYERRSCKSFSSKQIEKNILEEIANVSIYAASGMNKQSWQFTVISDKEEIAIIAGLIEKYLDRKNYNFYGATALVICSNDADNELGMEDCALSMGNMMLAAFSLGVGSCWTNQLRHIDGEKEVREYLSYLGVPKENKVYGVLALGYPDKPYPVKEKDKTKINIR